MKRFNKNCDIDIDSSMDRLRQFNKPLSIKKAIITLQGIATAIIYDGKVDDSEIALLEDWLGIHEEERDEWPISEVSDILESILEDNIVTQDERSQLFKVLSSFADSPGSNEVVDGICDENPKITFNNKEFVFTGILKFGRRKKAENAVMDRGGIISVSYSICKTLDYLIVGDLGNKTWKHSRFGSKIEKAIKRRNEGNSHLVIAKEDDFILAILSQEKS